MAERSRRSRKAIDYKQFGVDFGNSDSDDDFAKSTPPPPKKSKLSTKDNKKQQKTQDKSTNKNRKKNDCDLDEDVKAAIELSLSDDSQNTNPYTEAEVVPAIQSNGKNNKDSCDMITVISDDESPKKLPQEKNSGKRVKNTDLDTDYKAEDDEDDSEDDDGDNDEDDDDEFNPDDDDSDYDVKPTKKKSPPKKKPAKTLSKPKPKITTAVTPKAIPKKTKPLHPSSNAERNVPSFSTPPPRTGLSGTLSATTLQTPSPKAGLSNGRIPKWTPPASAGSASLSCLGSPSTGLRLGLSKNIKLKPLHSNFKPAVR